MRITFDTNALVEVFKEAQSILFDRRNISQVQFIEKNTVSNFDINNKNFLDRVKNQPIVYCIWCGDTLAGINPCYVGHVSAKISKQRMIAHFSRKNKATGSQLDKVKDAVEDGKFLGITFVIIDPPYMRKALEDWLIDYHSDILEWNKQGRRKIRISVVLKVDE